MESFWQNKNVDPYCADVNECELRKLDPTKYEKLYPCGYGSTCYDTPGDYKCKCNFGRRGDGKSDRGCEPIFPGYAIAVVGECSLFIKCYFYEYFPRVISSFVSIQKNDFCLATTTSLLTPQIGLGQDKHMSGPVRFTAGLDVGFREQHSLYEKMHLQIRFLMTY